MYNFHIYRMFDYLLTSLFWSVIFFVETVHPGVRSNEVVGCFVRFPTNLRLTVRVVDSNPMLHLHNTTNVIYFNFISLRNTFAVISIIIRVLYNFEVTIERTSYDLLSVFVRGMLTVQAF